MNEKWYVLHVITGGELEVQRQLQERGAVAIVVRETSLIRRGGHWNEQQRFLFPGYVFVYMAYTAAMHHSIRSIAGVIRLLPKDGPPQPLPENEAVWLLSFCGDTLAPSQVDFSGAAPVVVAGPLKGMEDSIVKFDFHRRRATLRLPVLREIRLITLSILPL